jgi:hypothetical protein
MNNQIKVMVPYDDRGHKVITSNIPNDRPSHSQQVALTDELHFWLKERNIEYSIIRVFKPMTFFPNCWFVGFTNKDDAMLFKLSWL